MAFEHAATVFHVRDLEASLKFYTEILGFERDFIFGDYAGIKSGLVSIHLAERGEGPHQRPIGGGTLYIFCGEVDTYYNTVLQKGAKMRYEPNDWPYGMRDFALFDPDGNQLAFGCEVKKA